MRPRPRLRLVFARPIEWRAPFWRSPFLIVMALLALCVPALLILYEPLRIRSLARDLAGGDWTAGAELHARCRRADPAVIRLLHHPSAAVRAHAVELSCTPLSAVAERALLERVGDAETPVALAAVSVLVRSAVRAPVRERALRQALVDPRPQVRRAAVAELLDRQGSLVERMLPLFYEREDPIGRTVFLELCLRRPRAEARAIGRLAAAEADPMLRARGEELLRIVGPAVPTAPTGTSP